MFSRLAEVASDELPIIFESEVDVRAVDQIHILNRVVILLLADLFLFLAALISVLVVTGEIVELGAQVFKLILFFFEDVCLSGLMCSFTACLLLQLRQLLRVGS